MIVDLLGRLAARLRGALSDDAAGPGRTRLDKPVVRRTSRYTSLQFTRKETQSRMLTDQPDLLLIDYTRTMMGALLINPEPKTIGMVGLGGGSQTKFCYRNLPQSRIEVVENNPKVIALRRAFRVPDDDERLQVVLDDGARFVRERPGRFDLLLVDGYDASGISASLASQAFYDDCRAALAAGGVVSVNLFGPDAGRHIEWIRSSFGASMLVIDESKMSNRVVLAWVGALILPKADGELLLPEALASRALLPLRPVFARVGSALRKWVETTAPIAEQVP